MREDKSRFNMGCGKRGFFLKEFFCLLIFAFCLLPSVFAQRTLWTTGTARTVPEGQQEFGIVHPLQMGVSPTMEVSVQPLMALALAPNVSIKKRWISDKWLLASQHTYVMPTMMLRTMRDLGWPKWKDSTGTRYPLIPEFINEGDSIPFTIPYIFTLRNEAILSRRIAQEMMVTGRVGFEFSLKSRKDSLPPIQNPFLYMHGTTLNPRMMWYTGARIDGNIVKNYNFMADVTFVSSGLMKDWAIEHRGYFIYNHSVKFAALVGYKMMYLNSPVESVAGFSILPVVDLIWKINIQPREPEKDLFRILP